MRSPGRPPVGRREHRKRFWEAIARGLSSEDAGVVAGVSPAVAGAFGNTNQLVKAYTATNEPWRHSRTLQFSWWRYCNPTRRVT